MHIQFTAHADNYARDIDDSLTYLLRSSKMSGRRKLSNDHSSARLFCNGVPVSSSLLAASYDFSALGILSNVIR